MGRRQRRSKVNAQVLASKGAGLSAEVLTRALETRSHAPRRAVAPGQVLKDQELARRYARAKAILAQKARETRLSTQGQGEETAVSPAAPAPPVLAERPSIRRKNRSLTRRLTRPVRRAWRHRQDWSWRGVVCAGVVAAALLVICHDANTWFHQLAPVRSGTTGSPAWQLLSSHEWFQRAEDRVAEGNFRRALNTVQYALAATPKNVDLLVFAGNMHQSLFEFADAQRAYEQALRFDPKNAEARENLTLCRRLNRYHDDAAMHRSSLYGLHRVMLGQSRISEAVAICRRLGKQDRALQQATWQAALSEAGLSGQVMVDASGDLELDLSNTVEPDLSLLKSFPLASLNLADTGLEDLRPLHGMKLKRLDLSRTLVHDLSPLRGMPLQSLGLRGTGVVELSAIQDCPLQELDLSGTKVGDLSALTRMPLHVLQAADTPVADLRPLATLPLKKLDLARSRVADLGALGNLGLQSLSLDGTRIADLSPLRGCRLRELHLLGTAVRDLSPLAGMPLTAVDLTGCFGVRDLRPLATCVELEHLQLPPSPLSTNSLTGLPRLHFIEGGKSTPTGMIPVTNPAGGAGAKWETALSMHPGKVMGTPPLR